MVSDTYSDSRGTSTNFTMHCAGERGDDTDVGWMRPMLLSAAIHTAIVLVIYHAVRTYGRLRRRSARSEPNRGRSGAAAPTLGG